MAQEVPNINRPPYESPMFVNGVLSTIWHQWFALVFQTISDLQRRVTLLGG